MSTQEPGRAPEFNENATEDDFSVIIRDQEITDGIVAGLGSRLVAVGSRDEESGEVSVALHEELKYPDISGISPESHVVSLFSSEFADVIEVLISAGVAAGVFNRGTSLVEPPYDDDKSIPDVNRSQPAADSADAEAGQA